MRDYVVMREKMPYERDLYRELQMIEERGKRLKEARRTRFNVIFNPVWKNIIAWTTGTMLKKHIDIRR